MLALGLLVAVDNVEKKVLIGEAAVGGDFAYSDDNLYLDTRFQMPDGRLLSWDEMLVEHPEFSQNGYDDSSGIQNVAIYIPGARYHDVERREALILLAFAAGSVGVAAVTVVRRRPR